MNNLPKKTVESQEMAGLRIAHRAFHEARHNAMLVHLGLAFTPSVDRTSVLAAIHILDEVDKQVAFRYGELCLKRDLPKVSV